MLPLGLEKHRNQVQFAKFPFLFSLTALPGFGGQCQILTSLFSPYYYCCLGSAPLAAASETPATTEWRGVECPTGSLPVFLMTLAEVIHLPSHLLPRLTFDDWEDAQAFGDITPWFPHE